MLKTQTNKINLIKENINKKHSAYVFKNNLISDKKKSEQAYESEEMRGERYRIAIPFFLTNKKILRKKNRIINITVDKRAGIFNSILKQSLNIEKHIKEIFRKELKAYKNVRSAVLVNRENLGLIVLEGNEDKKIIDYIIKKAESENKKIKIVFLNNIIRKIIYATKYNVYGRTKLQNIKNEANKIYVAREITGIKNLEYDCDLYVHERNIELKGEQISDILLYFYANFMSVEKTGSSLIELMTSNLLLKISKNKIQNIIQKCIYKVCMHLRISQETVAKLFLLMEHQNIKNLLANHEQCIEEKHVLTNLLKKQNCITSMFATNLIKYHRVCDAKGATNCKKIKHINMIQNCLKKYKNRHFEDALEIALSLLNSGCLNPQVLQIAIMANFSLFKFKNAEFFARLSIAVYPYWKNALFINIYVRILLLQNKKESGLKMLCLGINCYKIKPLINIYEYRINEKLKMFYGDLNWQRIFTEMLKVQHKKKSLALAKSLFLAEEYGVAYEICKNKKTNGYNILKAQILENKMQFKEAKILLEKTIQLGNNNGYKELLSVCNHTNDLDLKNKILNKYIKNEIQISDFFEIWICCISLGYLKTGFILHGEATYFNLMKYYTRDKFQKRIYSDSKMVRKTIVLSECFTGDEIRFSQLYPQIKRKIKSEECVFTCDKRLYSLMKRSFEFLNFFPVSKSRELEFIEDMSMFDKLPSTECVRYLDNAGWMECLTSDRIITVMHAMSSILEDKKNIEQIHTLKVDLEKRKYIKEQLCKALKDHSKKYIAGLSWRSSLSDPSRNMYGIDDVILKKILKRDDILWVSCQYDGCMPEEYERINAMSNGGFIIYKDIDQYNDIDSTASLYSCMNFIITPPTYTADLASAIGVISICPTKTNKSYCFCAPGTNTHLFSHFYEVYLVNNEESVSAINKRISNILYKIDAEN